MLALSTIIILLSSPFLLAEDIDKVQRLLNNLVHGRFYDDNSLPGPVDFPNNFLHPDDVVLPNTVLRDEEHLPYNPLWGHRYLSGGAGEGDQYLSPDGTIRNVHQVKTDSMLPSYCDPPNPCPEGYTAADGCLEEVPNTAEFSRDYQLQQNCACDPEHMFDCSNNGNSVNHPDTLEGAHTSVRGKKFSEKKSFGAMEESLNERYPRSVGAEGKQNPYLEGEHHRTVAKKSPMAKHHDV